MYVKNLHLQSAYTKSKCFYPMSDKIIPENVVIAQCKNTLHQHLQKQLQADTQRYLQQN